MRSSRPSELFTRSQPPNSLGYLTPGSSCKALAVPASPLSHIQNSTLRYQKIVRNSVWKGLFFHETTFRTSHGRFLAPSFAFPKLNQISPMGARSSASTKCSKVAFQSVYSKAYDRRQLCAVILLVARGINTSPLLRSPSIQIPH